MPTVTRSHSTTTMRGAKHQRASAMLYAVLAALTVANTADLLLTREIVARGGAAAEWNPILHGVLIFAGWPAFVAAKSAFALAEVVFALAIWQYVRPTTLRERRFILFGVWVCTGYMLALDTFMAAQLTLLIK